MLRIQATVIFVLCAVGMAVTAMAEPAVVGRDPDAQVTAAYEASLNAEQEVAQRLAVIRYQIAQANRDLAKENQLLNRSQREHELSDPIAQKLRAELVELEKAAAETRKSLKIRLEALSAVREIETRRQELMAQVQDLKNEETALLAGQGPGQPTSGRSRIPDGS